MPTWGQILQQIQASAVANGGRPDFDGIRRQYLANLFAVSGRPTILYSSNWIAGNVGGVPTMVTLEDMQAMMEVCKGLPGPNLDIILHSPGGYAEATASIVRYLRGKFAHIRVIVPLAAMSAATMWALSANEIIMGSHSQLGPIDPQMGVGAGGNAPARAIIRQFDRAVEECSKDPSKLAAWAPLLQQYGPALLEQCAAAEELGRRLVGEWLDQYMFAGQPNARRKANRAAKYFANYEVHRSHSLGITRDEARRYGLNIVDLEASQPFQDAVLSVHHATMHTFAMTGALKIVENHQGAAFVKMAQTLNLPIQLQPPPGVPPGSPPGVQPTLPGPTPT